MARWRIQRLQTGEWVDTGEVYDDTQAFLKDQSGNVIDPPLSAQDYVEWRRNADGWTHKAIAIEEGA